MQRAARRKVRSASLDPRLGNKECHAPHEDLFKRMRTSQRQKEHGCEILTIRALCLQELHWSKFCSGWNQNCNSNDSSQVSDGDLVFLVVATLPKSKLLPFYPWFVLPTLVIFSPPSFQFCFKVTVSEHWLELEESAIDIKDFSREERRGFFAGNRWISRNASTLFSRVFSHHVTAIKLVTENNETAAMLVDQSNPVKVELFSCGNTCYNKLAWLLFTREWKRCIVGSPKKTSSSSSYTTPYFTNLWKI